MTPLLRLYPRAWRERYGEELGRLLEDRPPGFLGMIDLMRGALDARMHASLVPKTAGGGSGPGSGDLPRGRARFPWVSFLGTLSAALFLIGAAIVFAEPSLPVGVSVMLLDSFLVSSCVTLGLTVLAATGRGVIAKFAGVAFIGSLVSLWWTDAWLPLYLPLLVGSVLLGVGSLVERQPARWIGGVAIGLAAAVWATFDSGRGLLGLVIGAYAILAVGLAWSARRSARPIVVGIAGAALLAGVMVSGTLATSTIKVHEGFAVQCAASATDTCLAAVDSVTARIRAFLPEDRIVWGSVNEDGAATVCTARARTASGAEGTYDTEWVDTLEEGAIGLRVAGGAGRGDDVAHYLQVCWAVDG